MLRCRGAGDPCLAHHELESGSIIMIVVIINIMIDDVIIIIIIIIITTILIVIIIDLSMLRCRGAGDPCMHSLLRTGWHTTTLM